MVDDNDVVIEDEPEVILDRRKLSAGAATIRDKFTPDDRKKITSAPRLDQSKAMERMSKMPREYAPQDVELAVIISGMERKAESEVAITNVMNAMHFSWPQLEKSWLKNLRKAVQYIRGSGDRASAKGKDKNVVNEDDFLHLCGHGQAKIEQANKNNPTLFKRGSTKAAVVYDPATGSVGIDTLSLPKFKAALNLVAEYRKSFAAGEAIGYQGVSVPDDVANQLYHFDLDLPPLNGIVTTPTFSAAGDLISLHGYNTKTGLYFAKSEDLNLRKVPRSVSQEDVNEAMRLVIEELLGDFELDGVSRADLVDAALGGDVDNPPPASVLNVIGMIIEQFVRPMINGPLMPHLITKTVAGAGGGLLSNCVQYIVEGKPSSRPMPKNEDERRKSLTTAFKSGAVMIAYDNVAGELTSPSIASATTEDVWTDRLLNQTAEVSIPIRASFMFVGIRPLLSDELRRRMSLIEMKPQTAKPELRSDFRHEDLAHYVKTHRGDFIWAVLVLVKNWIQKGCPRPVHAPIIGSYQAYRYVIGGIIEAAAPNWTTWQSNRHVLDEIASDGEEEEIENLLSAWWQQGAAPSEASDLCDIAETFKVPLPVKRVPLGDEFEYTARSMGRYLKGFAGRHFEMDDGTEVELCQSDKRGKGGFLWQLRKVSPKAHSANGTQNEIKFEPPSPKASPLLSKKPGLAVAADPFG